MSEASIDNPEFQNVPAENTNYEEALTSGTDDGSKPNENDGVNLPILDEAMQNLVLWSKQNPEFDLIVTEAIDEARNQHSLENSETQPPSAPNESSCNEETKIAEHKASEQAQSIESAQNESIKYRLRLRKPNLQNLKESAKRQTRKSTKKLEVLSEELASTLPENAMQSTES